MPKPELYRPRPLGGAALSFAFEPAYMTGGAFCEGGRRVSLVGMAAIAATRGVAARWSEFVLGGGQLVAYRATDRGMLTVGHGDAEVARRAR